VVIRFLLNEGADAHDIADRLQTDCRQIADRLQTDYRQTTDRLQTDCKHNFVNMLIKFERFNSGLQKYDSVVKIFMMRFTMEDLL
jgi:hypothetical protein